MAKLTNVLPSPIEQEVKTMVGKVALITGCSSGVGRELCRTLTEKGDRVVATARSLERLEEVSAALKVALDVTDQDSIKQAIAAVMNAYGRIDVLVNNAGYSVRSAVEEIDLEELAHLFDVNVYGIVRMIQAVAPIMRQQGAGKIINIGSVSGRLTGLVNGGYCASKHAVEAISDAARLELQGFGIQVSVLEPGAMDTDFFRTLSQNSDERMQNSQSPYHPFYQRDLAFRKKQKRADLSKATGEIDAIMARKRLKGRYPVALPFVFSLLLALPERLREWLMLRV